MDPQAAFAEILENLPRQHLRTRFRNHFGVEGESFGKETFARGSAPVALDRLLGHLLQEEPEGLRAVLLSGPAVDLGIDRLSPSSGDALGSLLTPGRALLVHGVTARLYAYLPPGEAEAWVRRVAVPKEARPSAAKSPAPILSRRQRAAAAGKRKPAKRSPPRRRN